MEEEISPRSAAMLTGELEEAGIPTAGVLGGGFFFYASSTDAIGNAVRVAQVYDYAVRGTSLRNVFEIFHPAEA